MYQASKYNAWLCTYKSLKEFQINLFSLYSLHFTVCIVDGVFIENLQEDTHDLHFSKPRLHPLREKSWVIHTKLWFFITKYHRYRLGISSMNMLKGQGYIRVFGVLWPCGRVDKSTEFKLWWFCSAECGFESLTWHISLKLLLSTQPWLRYIFGGTGCIPPRELRWLKEWFKLHERHCMTYLSAISEATVICIIIFIFAKAMQL